MGTIRDLSALHPAFQPRVRAWASACAAASLPVLFTETFRSWPVQQAYYARGRSPLERVNALHRMCGLREITEAQNVKITRARAGYSWHNYGLAVDFVPLVAGKPDWKYDPVNPEDYWDEIATLAQAQGMVWGKSFNDLPHVEWHPGWLNISSAKTWAAQNADSWVVPILA